MIPTWLDEALAAGAVLDLHHPDARAKLAELILEAVPGPKIAAAIAGSVQAVLDEKASRGRALADVAATDRRRISREAGNNAAQAVLFVLGLEEEVTPATAGAVEPPPPAEPAPAALAPIACMHPCPTGWACADCNAIAERAP